VLVSVIFSLLPLAAVSTISPLLTLRNTDFSPIGALSKRANSSHWAFLCYVDSDCCLLTESFLKALFFTLSLLAFVFILWGLSAFLIPASKTFGSNPFPTP
jgi:putative ABC transport system permease protein